MFQSGIWCKQPNGRKRSEKIFFDANFKIQVQQVSMLRSLTKFWKMFIRDKINAHNFFGKIEIQDKLSSWRKLVAIAQISSAFEGMDARSLC